GRAALTLVEKGWDTTLRGGLAVDEGRRPFSPGAVIPQSLQADLDMDRLLIRWTRGSLHQTLTAEKRVDWSPTGQRSETAKCSLAAKCRWAGLTAMAAAAVEVPEALGLSGSASFELDRSGDGVGLEVGTVVRPSRSVLDATVSIRRRLQDSQVQAQCGVANLPMVPPPRGLKDCLVLKLGWRTSLRKVAEPDGD
ncbi:MAG TPA: hypothetical protein VFH83_16315, partial [Spirochaetia bacterium]|nr:hypothetical protein [Spirochaetia bacterium]